MALSDSMAPELPVAIVLVNWNGWRECLECINSLLAQTYENYHVFIVDNDSEDRSVEMITAWCAEPQADPAWRRLPRVGRYTDRTPRSPVPCRVIGLVEGSGAAPCDCKISLVRSGGNLGFAGGCNVGIRVAGLDDFAFFWFLNPDTVVEHRALTELIARARRQPGMGIVGSTLLFYDKSDIVHALAGGHLNRSDASSNHIEEGSCSADVPSDGSAVERQLDFVCGASMLVAAEFIRRVGLMQEDYFLYYEEIDWAMRGIEFRLGFAPASVVYHKSGANSSKSRPLFTAGFYYRSRLRFVNRFLPDRMGAAKRRLFVEMLSHLARGRWSAARLVGATLMWAPPPCAAASRS